MRQTRNNHYTGRRGQLLWRVLLILFGTGLICFGALEICIAVGDGTDLSYEPDVMVIFGCQVKRDGPSILLRDRLETAVAYLDENPDLPVIVSGGKGDDEHMSEAQAMYEYLVEHGVPEEQITKEDQSRDTRRNLLFTRAILEEQGMDPAEIHILAVSSGFHLTRIRMLAQRFGYGEIDTLDAPSSHLPTAVYMFFREPLALVKSFVFDWE